MEKREKTNKSQVTLFVIIALILVVGITGFFIIKNVYFPIIPANIAPVYDYYLSCLADTAKTGASIMGSQAGYIKTPDFSPGSKYAPFSNQLGFMGRGIPYWYYISGNGVEKEQMPSLKQMNNQLADYIKENAGKQCDFSGFTNHGFEVAIEDASSSSASIEDNKISFSVSQRIKITRGEEEVTAISHSTTADSNLGKFYNLAAQIYNHEKSSLFLENYSTDVLNTYAPVSGVMFNCSPAVWSPYEVFSKLKNALAANIQMIKIPGNYYTPKKYSNYFVSGRESELNAGNSQVTFVYSSDWPSRFEVWPTKNNLMTANPVGTQEGMSMMGFCYVPYKFVYDMYFPVLVQIYDSSGQESFQFPLAVVISKNNPREALPSEYIGSPDDMCENANADLSVYTYDTNLAPIEADIDFQCLGSSCSLGKTKINDLNNSASLNAKVPACTNGVIAASSEGYKEQKYTISTNEESSANVVLNKEKKVNVKVYVDGSLSNDFSLISMNQNNAGESSLVSSVSYPYNSQMPLTDGDYKFTVKVFGSSKLVIPETKTLQCTKVPQIGIAGFFGFETDKCFDVTIPSQTLSNYVKAGGSLNYFVSQSELENANTIQFFVTSMKNPSTIEEAQENYDSADFRNMEVIIA